MKALVTDQEVLASLRPLDLVAYLRAHGWRPLESIDDDPPRSHDAPRWAPSMLYIVGSYQGGAMKSKRARLFWTGRSQAVCLPKELRFEGDTVLVRREGGAVILEPVDDWPEGYIESFSGIPGSFERLPQGHTDRREKLG